MTLEQIKALPVSKIAAPQSHLYLWVPNAMILEGFEVMKRWGFKYKTNIVWHKVREDGGSDGRGVGFYFRNVTELLLFGTREACGPQRRGDVKSISSPHGSASTLESPTRFIQSSKRAATDHSSNFSRVIAGRDGTPGGMKSIPAPSRAPTAKNKL
jgi:N6-adenosine-specific RNA methylase IME4